MSFGPWFPCSYKSSAIALLLLQLKNKHWEVQLLQEQLNSAVVSSRRAQHKAAAARVGIPEDGKSISATRWQRSPEVAAELLWHRLYLFPLLRIQGQSCICQKFILTNPIFRCPRGSPSANRHSKSVSKPVFKETSAEGSR